MDFRDRDVGRGEGGDHPVLAVDLVRGGEVLLQVRVERVDVEAMRAPHLTGLLLHDVATVRHAKSRYQPTPGADKRSAWRSDGNPRRRLTNSAPAAGTCPPSVIAMTAPV